MPFILEEESEQIEAGPGFILSDREDSGFSFKRDILGPAKEFGVGALETASRAFGGGRGSVVGEGEDFARQRRADEYARREQQLLAQGMEPQAVEAQLGPRPKGILPDLGEFIDESTGGQLLPQNMRQRSSQSAAKGAGEFFAAEALLPGGINPKWVAAGGLFGLGEQMAEEGGASEGAKLGTGAMFAILPFLASGGKKGAKAAIDWGRGLLKGKGELPEVPRFLEEAGTKAAEADLTLSARDLTGRVAKTSEDMLDTLDRGLQRVAEPAFKDVGTFRAADLEESIIKGNQRSILDQISPGAPTQKAAWEGVQQFVENEFGAMKESYSKLYNAVESGIEGINAVPKRTFEAAKGVVRALEDSIIKVPEEAGIRRSLEEVVELLKPMEQGNLVEIPAQKLLAGKRSINRLLERSDIIPAPIDLLKPVSRAMKADAIEALGSRPGMKKMYETAEDIFGQAQELYNNDAIVKMRKSQTPEALSAMFSKPSNLERLNKVVGDNPRVKDFVDRLVVENIASKSEKAARELAQESREYLSAKAQKSLAEMLEYGKSLTNPGQKEIARGRIFKDLQEAMATGSRPDVTLKMMRNPTGYDLVKESLDRSPKGRRMWKSLQRQTVEDVVASVVGDNKAIDFAKTKDIMSDPHVKQIIQDTMGKEGVAFFNKLERYGQNMADNLRNLAIKDPLAWEKLVDRYLDSGSKYVLYALAGPTKGLTLVPLLGKEVVARAQRQRLYRLVQNPQGRGIIEKMGSKKLAPAQMQGAVKRFASLAAQKQEEDE